MPGPPKIPSKILEARDSRYAKRRQDEPEAPEGVPEPPPDWALEPGGDIALAAWEWAVPLIEAMGILTLADRAALILMCEAWRDYRIAMTESLKVSGIYADDKGMKRHPAQITAENAWNRWLKMGKEFGLTASGRASLAIDRKNPDETRGRKPALKNER